MGAIAISMALVVTSASQEVVRQVGIASPDAVGANLGFDTELMEVIADWVGFHIQIHVLPGHELLSALLAGEVDVVIGAVSHFETGAPGVAFTQTAALNTGAFVILVDSRFSFHSISELQDRVLGVAGNTVWERQLIDAGLRNIRTFPDHASATAALMAREVEAYYTNRAVTLYWQYARGSGCAVRALDDHINTDFPLARLAVRAGDLELLNVLDHALSDLRSLGVLFGGTFHYHPGDVHVAPLCH
jgi:ABC-type amino acid transport substrate-binding protein